MSNEYYNTEGRVLTVRNPDAGSESPHKAVVALEYEVNGFPGLLSAPASAQQGEQRAREVTFDDFVDSSQLLSLAELEKLTEEEMARRIEAQVKDKAKGLILQVFGKAGPPELRRLEGAARMELD
jgi:hypothetical protein